MKKCMVLSCVVVSILAWCGSVYAQDAVEEQVQLPAKDSAEYAVVRSRAVSDLTSFLTKKRIDLDENLAYFVAFLDKLGKADDFITTPMDIPKDPKQRFAVLGVLEDEFADRNIRVPEKAMSWNEMMEIAMRFRIAEGYLPVSFADGEELKTYKDILKRRESLPRKMWADVNKKVEACLKAWTYLGTINQQQGFKLFRFKEREEQTRLEEERRAEASAARSDRSRQMRGSRKEAELRRRQDRLSRRYTYSYWGR
jgi:hypothetical protein